MPWAGEPTGAGPSNRISLYFVVDIVRYLFFSVSLFFVRGPLAPCISTRYLLVSFYSIVPLRNQMSNTCK